MRAIEKLNVAIVRTGCAISAGIEPSPEYLPPDGFSPDPEGYLSFFRVFIDATRDLVAAYKFNLAFFESQGVEGVRLLHSVRDLIPDDALVIIDAKRGDIGSTAKHYARSIYEGLGADSTTVNPLMGRDSAEPFLAYTDRLTYFLALTSNPGARDFLLPERLYLSIAGRVREWADGSNAGLVVGATKGASEITAIRRAAPDLPFLVPGLGAQGGDAGVVCGAGAMQGDDGAARIGGFEGAGLLLHATRGLLPAEEDAGRDPAEVIREKALGFAAHLRSALSDAGVTGGANEEVKR